MSSVRCHQKMYVQKVERGASIPKCLTSSEKKTTGYSLIKLPLHSEMADTNTKTHKATLPVMAHNLCTKPFLSQEPEDSSTPREAANHSTDYSCLAFHDIQSEENKIMSGVSKQRGSEKQQWWPHWQVPPPAHTGYKPLVGWWCSPVSPQDGSWQECTSALLLLQLDLCPESGRLWGMWLLKLLSVTEHRMWGQLVSLLQVCSAEIIRKSNPATETSHLLRALSCVLVVQCLNKGIVLLSSALGWDLSL